jgi:SAM-dependent methyltransferase
MTGKPAADLLKGWLSLLILTGLLTPLQRLVNRRRASSHSLDLFYSLLPGFEFLCPRNSVLRYLDSFLNWGFYPGGDHPNNFTDFVSKLPPAVQQFPLSAYHYYRLLEKGHPDNKSILEVGCGKGGGCRHVIAPFFSPKKYVGLDVNSSLINACKAHNLDRRFQFMEGSALDLPFASNSFDIVLNVESSHCYPSFKTFLKEVERVLRPGGQLIFCDLRWWMGHDIKKNIERQLHSTNMEVVAFEEITNNIIMARKLVSKHITRMDKLIFKYNPEFADSCCLEGSTAFEMLQNGKILYFEAILEKKDLICT